MADEKEAKAEKPEAPKAEGKPEAGKPEAGKPKGEKKPEKAKGGGKGKGDKAGIQLEVDEKPNSGPIPRTRLREYYASTVRTKLSRQFGFKNPHQIPKLVKIVLNVGAGQAVKNPKLIDAIVAELGAITGQKPTVNRAKKAISNFSLRQGLPIGASVTLRGTRMYEFLDRFISVTVPRFRDFRGLPTRSFDGRGNYTLGIKEQMVFPEIDYDKVETIHGMDITFVTTAGRDDVGMRSEERRVGKEGRGGWTGCE